MSPGRNSYEKCPESTIFGTLFMYAKEHDRCDFAYRAANTAPLRGMRDSKGAQLLGARPCLQGLVRYYTVQAGDRAKQPAYLMGSAGSRGTEGKSRCWISIVFSFIEDCAV